jgi:hypothetical protein
VPVFNHNQPEVERIQMCTQCSRTFNVAEFSSEGRIYRSCNRCRLNATQRRRNDHRLQEWLRALPMARRWSQGEQLPIRHRLSDLIIECSECKALHFLEEKLVDSTIRRPKFGKCCAGGCNGGGTGIPRYSSEGQM